MAKSLSVRGVAVVVVAECVMVWLLPLPDLLLSLLSSMLLLLLLIRG